MHDTRAVDRTPVHYAVMAPSSSHSRTHSQPARQPKPSKSTTPVASPWAAPHSVGQNYPPKMSPNHLHGGHATDTTASSPNYFGLAVDSSNEQGSSGMGMARDNWSPSSSIKSFAAAIPKQVPLDANPEFEAFKRQADLNRGKSFALSTSHYVPTNTSIAPVRPRPPRWHTHASDTGSEMSFGRSMSSIKDRPTNNRMDVDQDSLHDSAYVSAESKRNSEASLFPLQMPNMPKFQSPQPMDSTQSRSSLTRAEDRDPRLSVMEHRVEAPSPNSSGEKLRSNTVPAKIEPGQPTMINPEELKALLKEYEDDQVLLLDIRSSQNYSQARIKSALNLCIPTTLLKRATFNIQKLQQTFQVGSASTKFSHWRSTKCIIVYDSHSSDKRDAVTAQNMIKKFTNEGYNGKTCILRGGFVLFQNTYPNMIDHTSTAQPNGSKGRGLDAGLAPVIGGVKLPMANNSANPFFSNIRQNMDLADGVGQMDVKRPDGLQSPLLPRWLRDAASQSDHGKDVSQKFLNIEVDEQTRMKKAYAAFDSKNPEPANGVQLCGVEKGVKNRYKDILPFEHARVKLQNTAGDCDYINASHIKATGSNKKYIASQGPLPATFEDFWSVIWEQDIRVIVMLTAESEGGQLKCHPYWQGREYGDIKLRLLSEKKASLDMDKHKNDAHSHSHSSASSSSSSPDMGRKRANTTTTLETTTITQPPVQTQAETPHIVIRKFALAHSAHPFAPMREITHLHFPSWPDFGTPAQASQLLALIELANVMQRAALPVETSSIVGSRKDAVDMSSTAWYDEPEADAEARPMLVHCSAGCGRTGTFCTVDSVIDMMKRQRQTKISATQAPDEDGDVEMSDVDDAPSPSSARKPSFKSVSSRRNIDKRLKNGAMTIDTTWVQDDGVDLIHKTVDDFRQQRLSMVQSLRQYVLCYETVLEWLNRINEPVPTAANGRARSGSLQQFHR